MFDSLYGTKEMKSYLGRHFCGPDKLPNWQKTRIAVFEENPKNDGHGVEIYCTAAPAKFYTIRALEAENALGETMEEFTLCTGSGAFEWAVATAKMINEGMLGCPTAKWPRNSEETERSNEMNSNENELLCLRVRKVGETMQPGDVVLFGEMFVPLGFATQAECYYAAQIVTPEMGGKVIYKAT